MDSALAASGQTRDQIIESMNQFRRTSRGGRHAMEAAAYGDGAAIGYEESCLRAALIEAGFEAPELHVSIASGNGERVEGTFGWKLEDGSWIVAQLAGPRYANTPTEADDVNVISIPRALAHDANSVIALLEEVGVPHAAEPPQVGIAKPFKPVYKGSEEDEA